MVVLHRVQVVLLVLIQLRELLVLLLSLAEVVLIRPLAASTAPGAVGSVTQFSAQSDADAASHSSSLGTFPWILDSGASFHMTPDHTSLSSISTPSIPITAQTADGSSLCCKTGNSFISLFSCTCCFLCSQINHAAYLCWPGH